MNNKGRNRWWCNPCGKVAFGSQARALETLDWASQHPGKTPCRAYECDYGNGYHLTSKRERVS